MRVRFAVDSGTPYRTLILASTFSHCLNDLLFRRSNHPLQIDVVGIVSNHLDCEALATSCGVPYHHVPVTAEPGSMARAEAEMLRLVDDLGVHLVVLARSMQVLSDDTCRALCGRAINIHHSFRPSFKGARPCHQGFDRGVKLIGATAHYVTADLDEGPIIEQEVARVGHSHSPAALAAVGRDLECVALARAVRWHLEHRVFVDGQRTVVFP
ncbi:MAG: formyltetrahydrofolate deformylase [Nocardioidaceae bacterium]|nr:formyltetrahydrofolate deformylase [Nocardioidaceae bacterium]